MDPQNNIPDNNKISNNLNPFHYYKYEDIPSNLSRFFNNNSNSLFSQADFSTTILNNNSQNNYKKIPKSKSMSDIDARYYSFININKRFPLNQRFSSIVSRNKLINSNSINSSLYKANQNYFCNTANHGSTNINNSSLKKYFDKNKNNLNSIFNKKTEKNISIKDKKKQPYTRENDKEMKNKKIKLFKIIHDNRQQVCQHLEKRNDKFNAHLNNYYHSYGFFEKTKNYHKFFHFGKKYTNTQNEIYKHFLDLDTLKNSSKLTSKEILNLLSKRDKSLISFDPLYFLGDKNYLYELTAKKKQKLVDKINSEDEETKNTITNPINIISKLNKSKSNIEVDDDKIYDEKLIKQIINEDLDKRLNNNSSDKTRDIEKEMKKYVLDLLLIKKKESLFENGKYYKTFKDKLPYSYTKEYQMNKNYKRIISEKKFHDKRRVQNSADDETHKIILKYQKILEDIYKKNKK